MMHKRKKLLVNLTRTGAQKNGLFIFSERAINCLVNYPKLKDLQIFIPKESPLEIESSNNKNIEIINTPSLLSISSPISRLRPILWLFYSMLFLPKNELVLSTTHHGIPYAKSQILTIHDLRPYYYPDSFSQYFYFHYILPKLARRAAGIITVSNTSKKNIHETYQIDLNKIFVVSNFVDTSTFSPLGITKISEPPYLLMVGATWKHKNAHELIENAQSWSKTFRLKIISSYNNYQKRLRKMVRDNGLEKNVDFLNSVSRFDLISLYQNASALIYPSFVEGFGIPPLEAMACGIPTIVSNIEVFRELYAEVPIYVKLGDSASWSSAFKSLKDKNFMETKAQAGLSKAKEFNKERMCNSLIFAVSSIWPEININ